MGVQFIAMAAFVFPVTLSLLHAERSANIRIATLGDGIDELSGRLGPAVDALGRSASGPSGLLTIAVTSTLVSFVAVGIHAGRMVRGFGDAGAALRHGVSRIRRTSGDAAHHWGVVRDATSDHGLPFARIHLMTMDGNRRVASTVADAAGRFGFGVSLAQVARAGLKLSAHKSGYYFPSRKQPVGHADVYMDSMNTTAGIGFAQGKLVEAVSGAAFWVSVASVPLVSVEAPYVVGAFLVGSLVVTACARITGFGRTMQRAP
jgi:hypothetical protein